MPAKSAAQQKAAGAALSAKRGDTPKSQLKGASKYMVESMSEAQLEEFASTKRKGKPEHTSDTAARKTSRKRTAKKSSSRKTAAKKTSSRKIASKKTSSRKTASKRAPAKKSSAKRSATKKSATKKSRSRKK